MKRSAQKNIQNFTCRTVKPLAGRFSVVCGLLDMPFVGEGRLAYRNIWYLGKTNLSYHV